MPSPPNLQGLLISLKNARADFLRNGGDACYAAYHRAAVALHAALIIAVNKRGYVAELRGECFGGKVIRIGTVGNRYNEDYTNYAPEPNARRTTQGVRISAADIVNLTQPGGD